MKKSIFKKIICRYTIQFILGGFIMMVFGVFAFFSNMVDTLNNDTGEALPIQDINGFVTDSKGYIYIGDAITYNIQVFNPEGQFQDSFSIYYDEKEFFEIAMDENDILHLLTDEMHRTYENGTLKSVENISYDEYEILKEKYPFTDGDSHKTDNKSYVLLIFNRVLVSSSEERQIIKLDLPWWPLHPFIGFAIAAIGFTVISKCVEIKREEKTNKNTRR